MNQLNRESNPHEGGIAARAEAQLLNCNYLFSPNTVACRCRDGVLTIVGSVQSYYLKQVAQTLVAKMGEGIRIDNRIEVTSATRC